MTIAVYSAARSTLFFLNRHLLGEKKFDLFVHIDTNLHTSYGIYIFHLGLSVPF